ncbi:hypothetical protein H310_12989 [Aphanomyces invadans]|uniref:Purple acid phosphatase n=1 Tax=Aphanomyces invadans TaxID=157072 RepID=A0A024TFG9_9STRA|nr:hypothetical protein H310_12989 [Aphanomyces invadans]ETV92759.1 hypothetical protein H310_12989 [Aphanomyces invadans]|eukprot:XP_008878529.1 hypothetical protein H310_12989 [Aphanomyces invadans]
MRTRLATAMAVLAGMGTSESTLLAVSQVHLALTNAVQECPNGVAVSFASQTAAPFDVRFTIKGYDQWSVRSSTSDSYSVTSGRYSYQSPQLHTAFLCNLAPLTAYDYAIGNRTSTFVTPPAVGSEDAPTVLGVVGDPGDTSDSSQTLRSLGEAYRGLPTQAILIAGDYSYANGEHEVWDKWYDVQEDVFARVPQLGINGNHETITSHGHTPGHPVANDMAGEDYVAYLKRAVTPLSGEAKAAKRTYYSFDVGVVHLVFLDDYWKHERAVQLAWLDVDLAGVNRTITPWVVVVKHNPFYNTWMDHQCQCSKHKYVIAPEDAEACWNGQYVSGSPMYEPACGLQAKFESLFVKYRVNVVIAGHVHGYERTAPIVNNEINATHGVVYVTTGAGGNYEGHAGPRVPGTLPPWSTRVNNQVYGAAKVIATGDWLEVLWFANTHGMEPWDAVTLTRREDVDDVADEG